MNIEPMEALELRQQIDDVEDRLEKAEDRILYLFSVLSGSGGGGIDSGGMGDDVNEIGINDALRVLGVSSAQICRLVKLGKIRRVRRGVLEASTVADYASERNAKLVRDAYVSARVTRGCWEKLKRISRASGLTSRAVIERLIDEAELP